MSRPSPARRASEHGDDVEVVLLSDGRGGYTKASYVHDHTSGVRYTFVKAKTGCLAMLAVMAAGRGDAGCRRVLDGALGAPPSTAPEFNQGPKAI